jgi:hypothetical protein
MSDPHHWADLKEQMLSIGIVGYVWERLWSVGDKDSCRYCGHLMSKSGRGGLDNVDHHLDLLNMSDEIRAARGAILRLVPQFKSHPIFEADKPTV